MPLPTNQEVRQAILRAVEQTRPRDQISRANWQEGAVFEAVANMIPEVRAQQVVQTMLLDEWSELFRTGILVWGLDLGNNRPPFFHVSERGQLAMRQLARDPTNPMGYMAYLDAQARLNPIARAYVAEGLECFNNGLHRAAAVMVGAGIESVVLELRDKLVARLGVLGVPFPAAMQDWKPATVAKEMAKVLDAKKPQMPPDLRASYEAHWSSLIFETRRVRNDAGHPASIDPIAYEEVHGVLLTVPITAHFALQLGEWIGAALR